MSKIKTCTVCGKKYEFCAHCRRINSNDLWKNLYCSNGCREIMKVCQRYIGNDITANDAYEIIKKNLKGGDLQMSVKNVVDTIIKEADTPKVEPKQEPIVEEEKKFDKTPRRYRRRKTNEE